MVSGKMMDQMGAKKTFAIFSACSLATLVLYFAYVNVLVHICTWNKARKHSKAVKLSTAAGEETEGVQLLLSTEDTDESSPSEKEETDD